jgi:hypothetical protein
MNVLEKIRDPESDPSRDVLTDPSLPKDPKFRDKSVYEVLSHREAEIVLSMQTLELQLAGLRPNTSADPIEEYRKCVARLGDLIAENPEYASARNNRAQALRRMYGDSMLVADNRLLRQALLQNADQNEKLYMSDMALSDLDRAIALLSPPTPYDALSPQAVRTLSMAHTQRAAIYHTTSKLLPSSPLLVSPHRREVDWTRSEFEEAASRDFAMGGRYGNDVAKGLAVSTNPTAKLCGQIVREAMKKEYGFGSGL